MYRQPGPVEDTVISYVSRAMVIDRIALGIALILVGLGFVFSIRPCHLTCERDVGVATCTLAHVGVVTTKRTMALGDITALELVRDRGPKNGPRAQARLHLRSFENILLDAENGDSDAAATMAVDKADFDAFAGDPARTRYDAWFGRTLAKTAGFVLGALLFVAFGAHLLWEQLRQRRPVRVVVDHSRRQVRLAGGVVAFDDIADVRIEEGRAYVFKGKKELVGGHRLTVVRTDGRVVAAARHFDQGGGHVAAKAELLAALGRVTAPVAP